MHQTLWEEIRRKNGFYGQGGLSWILMGDFSETFSSSEHSHFQDVISGCGLSDLNYSGPKFTWWNHHDARDLNSAQSITFLHSYVELEANGIS